MENSSTKKENQDASKPSKNPPFPEIIQLLRKRRGLKPDDTSEDVDIAKYSPRKALDECCAWHIGPGDWSGSFLEWAKGAGYSISQKSEESGSESPS